MCLSVVARSSWIGWERRLFNISLDLHVPENLPDHPLSGD
jgi:hypothetical protein